MREAVVTHAVRTAVGVLNGALAEVDEPALSACVLNEIVGRSGLDSGDVDEVIMGSVRMNTRPMNVARYALLQAGMSPTIPGYTLHRACSSSSQAVFDAAMMIGCGDADVIIAGGVENMSMSPYFLRGARAGVGNNDAVFLDSLTESGRSNTPEHIYGPLTMGLTAENLVDKYDISRVDQDRFALNSQNRAKEALANKKFEEQIVRIGEFCVDEGPRDVTMERLARLKPVFRRGGTVTAGNSCGRNDGASAVMVMSREKADSLNIPYYLKHVSSAVVGVDPKIMGIGPVPATKKALEKAGLSLAQIDLIELNEAFASQALAVIRQWACWDGEDDCESLLARTNVNGGAIALGHPMGATGGVLLTKLFYEMRQRPGARYGLVTMCIGGGMGFASIFERCGG